MPSRPDPLFGNHVLPALAFGLLLICFGTALPAGAQTRSDTGRHRPPKAEPPRQEPGETRSPGAPAADRGWTFGASVGQLGAGRAFQVETLNGAAVLWDLGGGSPFQASRFNATFDQNLSMGLQVGKGLGRCLAAQGSLGYASMNLGAEILAGQQGTVVLLDQVDVLTAGLGLVGKLVAAPSHPFVSAEAVLTNLGAGHITALDQTVAGWRLGLGYRQVFSDRWAARAQVRLGRSSFTLDGFTPTTVLPDQPAAAVNSEDHLTFYEFMLSVEIF